VARPAPTRESPAASPPGTRDERASTRWVRAALAQREASIVAVTLATAAFFAVTTDGFFTAANLVTLLPYFAPIAILAVGEVMVMVAGEIDLSIGSVSVFSPFVVYELYRAGLPLAADLVLSLACCAAVGIVNGVVTAVIGVPSFVTTLGTLLGLGGLTLIVSHAAPAIMPGSPLAAGGGSAVFSSVFGAGTYSDLIWALAIVVAGQVVLRLMRWGIYTVAAGSNRTGAAEAGIAVKRIVIWNFVLSSVLAGLVGVLEATRTSTVSPNTAAAGETMFRTVSAAVIGGTLLSGGAGTAVGALFGALFLGILRDGLTLGGTRANYLDFILGIGIVVAMLLNVLVRRARQKRAA
jgi:simple sugar transport system permease protein